MTTVPAPTTVEEYISWAKQGLNVDFGLPNTKNRYDVNVQAAQNAIQDSAYISNMRGFLESEDTRYKERTGINLLTSLDFTVIRKPFSSAVEKSFRHNILKNREFPKAPPWQGGWITPDNWYTRFDDLVRGTLVCKFMDGPSLLAEALDSYATQLGLKSRHVARGTENGYYAFHHYTTFGVDVMDGDWNSTPVTVELELQITTQLQEVLRNLTHPLYEIARSKRPERGDLWKWDHDSPRFRASYLGHTLHMIEAIMLQVRNSLSPPPNPPASDANPPLEALREATEGISQNPILISISKATTHEE